MITWKHKALACVVLAGTGYGVISALAQKSPAPSTSPIPLAAAVPAARIVGPGRVEPDSGEIDLAAEMNGVVARVLVREGDPVKVGQVLVELAQGDLQARLDEAEATFNIKSLAHEKLKNGPRPEERKQIAATLQEQETTLNLMKKRVERQTSLYRNGYLTPDTMDEAKTALGTARKLLEKTRIRATVNGTVLRLYKAPGEAASLQQTSPLVQIGDLSKMVVRVQIDEADIAQLKLGQRVQVTAPAYPGRSFGGQVTQISPRLGTKTILTGAPTEKHDSRVLDTIVTLDPDVTLPVGLRVDAYIATGS